MHPVVDHGPTCPVVRGPQSKLDHAWKTWALYSALALVGLILPHPFANACGITYTGEEYRVAFLNPYMIGEEWSAFFFSAERINHTRYDKNGSDRQRNCREWAAYCANGATITEVKAIVYDASYDELLNAVAEGPGAQCFGENAFFKALTEKGRKPMLDYLLLAKEYEHYSFLESRNPWADQWDGWEENLSFASKGKQKVFEKVSAKFKAETDPFLRRRYAYQLLVMSAYAQDQERFEQLYASFFRDDRSSVLSDWATYHRATIVGDSVEANYLLAMSFARCPDKRITCYQRFDKSKGEATLRFCKNEAEKATVRALMALRNPGRALPELQQVVATDPRCPLIPLLLVREISKLEDWLLTDELTGMGRSFELGDVWEERRWEWDDSQWEKFNTANHIKDKAYLAELRNFLVGLSGQKGLALSADMANLFAGHLFLIDQQGLEAEKHFAAISANPSPSIAEQQLTEQILLVLNRQNIADAAVKNRLASLLVQLQKAKTAYKDGGRDFAALNLMLCEAYLAKGDLMTAFFFNNHTLELPTASRYEYGTAYYELFRFLDWRASEKDIDLVLALIEKRGKSAFEAYLASAPVPSRNALLDLRGTISFRKNDLPQAQAAFSKVDQDFWQTKYEFANYLVSDPFVLNTDSLSRGVFPATKTALVEQMMKLEAEAKAIPAKTAQDYLKLGNLWLNCSYRGKSWMMFSYGNSTSEFPKEYRWQNYSYQPRSKEMVEVYYNGSRAQSYFEKAKAATNDRELQSKAAYLAARLRAMTYVLKPEEKAELEALDWQDTGKFHLKVEMAQLKDWVMAYKSTAYFEEVATVCPMLKTYWGK